MNITTLETTQQLLSQIQEAFATMDDPEVAEAQQEQAMAAMDNIVDAFGLEEYERLADSLLPDTDKA